MTRARIREIQVEPAPDTRVRVRGFDLVYQPPGQPVVGPTRVRIRGLDLLSMTLNTAPIVSAGPDQLLLDPWSDAPVVLTGTYTDAEGGGSVAHTWTQTAGPPVVLAGTGPGRTFVRPKELDGTSLTFEYRAVDAQGAVSNPDAVTVSFLPIAERAVINGQDVPMRIEAVVNAYVPPAPPNTPPVAAFTTSANGLAVTATSTSTDAQGPIASYAWAFGDGGTATGATATRTYAAAGTYTITLTVTDSAGATASTTRTVTVTAPVVVPPTGGTATIFVRSDTETANQSTLRTAVVETALGKAVDHNIAAAALTDALIATAKLVVIADGVLDTAINPTLKAATCSVVTFSRNTAKNALGLAGTESFPASITTAYLHTAAAATFGAGLPAGVVEVYGAAGTVNAFGATQLGAGAVPILHRTEAGADVLSFAYDKGAALWGTNGNAPGRRAFGQWRADVSGANFRPNIRALGGALVTWAAAATTPPAAVTGNNVIGTDGQESLVGGYATVSKFTSTAQTGVTRISAYLDGNGTQTAAGAKQSVSAVLYADDGAGRPGALLATSAPVEITQGEAGAWRPFTIPSTSIPAGSVWLGLLISGFNNVARLYYSIGADDVRRFKATATAPNPWGADHGGDSRLYSIHLGVNTSTPNNTPPAAAFTATASGATATITDSSTDTEGPIASRVVAWGDGTTTTLTAGVLTASHPYTTSGSKTITLTVTDSSGATATTTRTVTVTVAAPNGGEPTLVRGGIPVVTEGTGLFSPTKEFAKFQVHTYTGPLDVNSAAMTTDLLRQIAKQGSNSVGFNTEKYNANTWLFDDTTPRYNVRFKPWNATQLKHPQWENYFGSVPIPDAAFPSLGDDRAMILYNPDTGELIEMWKVRPEPGRPGSDNYYNAPYDPAIGGEYQASFGGRIPDVKVNNGTFPTTNGWTSGTAATSISYLNTAISVADIEQGAIEHVIALQTIDASHWTDYSWPALRTDGNNLSPIRQGQRGRFPPGVDFDTYPGLNAIERMICKAIQKYGVVPTDKAGNVVLVGESGSVGLNADGTYTNRWPELRTTYAPASQGFYNMLKNIPWNLMEWLPKDWGQTLSVADTRPGTPSGIDYSNATRLATFTGDTAITKVSGPGVVTTGTVDPPRGQSSFVHVEHTGVSVDTVFEMTFPPVDLTKGFIRVPLRMFTVRSGVRYIRAIVAADKAAFTAGNYRHENIMGQTDTTFGPMWSAGSLDPAFATVTGTPSMTVGYLRIIANLANTTSGNLSFDLGHVDYQPRAAGTGCFVIGVDDSAAAAVEYLPSMNARGMVGTNWPAGLSSANATVISQVKQLHAAGWEIGVHAYGGHYDLNADTDAKKDELRLNFRSSLDWLTAQGVVDNPDHVNFAWWGPGQVTGLERTAGNVQVISEFFASGRFTAQGDTRPETRPVTSQYLNRCRLIGGDTLDGPNGLKQYVLNAEANGGIAELCLHGSPPTWWIEFLDWLVTRRDAGLIRVVTKAQALGIA